MEVIIHNVRSAQNVGSIFRTADGAGISHIYLSGYSPAPRDRFDRPVKRLAKVSLGAEKNIPWSRHPRLGLLLARLKKQGYKILALEQDKRARDLSKIKLPVAQKDKTVLLVGNEITGLSQATLKKADQIVEIPMRGKKESLNVAVAAGIALYWLLVLR